MWVSATKFASEKERERGAASVTQKLMHLRVQGRERLTRCKGAGGILAYRGESERARGGRDGAGRDWHGSHSRCGGSRKDQVRLPESQLKTMDSRAKASPGF